MSHQKYEPKPAQFNLEAINASLCLVQKHWDAIDILLMKEKIGKRDTPFTTEVREHMMAGYAHASDMLVHKVRPFSQEFIAEIPILNNRIHYGTDTVLMREYSKAINATYEKFQTQIETLTKWYRHHHKQGDHPLKLASEIYVAVLGHPQLFIEGNHRTGTLIADLISAYYGFGIFVLTAENAIPYFKPSSEIKQFTDKSTWAGRRKLPKYRKSFREFWDSHIDKRYCIFH